MVPCTCNITLARYAIVASDCSAITSGTTDMEDTTEALSFYTMDDVTEATAISQTFDKMLTTVQYTTSNPALPSGFKHVVVVYGTVINVFGAIGGLVIVIVMASSKSMRKPYNAFVASMAINDMMLCGVTNMIQVAGIHQRRFALGKSSETFLCRLHNIIWTHLVFITMLHILVIAGHRYLAVYHQNLSARITNKLTILLLICVLHMLTFCLFGLRKLSDGLRFISPLGSCVTWSTGPVNLALISANILITSLVLLSSYISIHYKVYSVKKQLQAITSGAAQNTTTGTLKKTTHHKKIIQSMVIIFLLLTGGYLPLIGAVGRLIKGEEISGPVLSLTLLFLWTSNAANSFVYSIFDRNFRTAYRKLFRSRIAPSGGPTTSVHTLTVT